MYAHEIKEKTMKIKIKNYQFFEKIKETFDYINKNKFEKLTQR